MALQIKEVISIFCENYFIYVSSRAVKITKCSATSYKVLNVTKYVIGIWTPMLIITVSYIAMFLKLRMQARIRAQSTGTDTSRHIQGISRTFLLTVCVFFICLLPFSVMVSMAAKLERLISIVIVWDLSIPLANLNSCLNPLIYAKVHRKIYLQITNMIRGVRRCFERQSNDIGVSKTSNKPKCYDANHGRAKYSDGCDKEDAIEMVEFDNNNADRNHSIVRRNDKADKDPANVSTCIEDVMVDATTSSKSNQVDSPDVREITISEMVDSSCGSIEGTNIAHSFTNNRYEPDETNVTIL